APRFHGPMRAQVPRKTAGPMTPVRCDASLHGASWASPLRRSVPAPACAWRQARARWRPPGSTRARRNQIPRILRNSCCRPFRGLGFANPTVAAFFELECQFAPARTNDAAAGQHVYEVGNDVVEQTLVVRDDDQGPVRRTQTV